ncbi:RNA polymerase sigma factor [Halobacillus seohaensis]|uniref:RNA polymerase sigma factor n=1 Tax=Halobacillus seohaensis TaxID=447421 RepID=A0ABW2EN89_9BACI
MSDINFNDLFTKYYSRVYYTALKITKETSAAEDVLQETFIKAYDKFNEIKDVNKVGAWLSTIASRKAIDFLRKEKKIVLLSIEDYPILLPFEIAESKVENECEQIILEEEIKKKISTLSPKLRSVFQLHYNQQLRESEIASKLNLSKAAVKSRLYRARLAMKNKMKSRFEEHNTA